MSGSAALKKKSSAGHLVQGFALSPGQAKAFAVLQLGKVCKQALYRDPCFVHERVARTVACTAPEISHTARDGALQQDSSAIHKSHLALQVRKICRKPLLCIPLQQPGRCSSLEESMVHDSCTA